MARVGYEVSRPGKVRPLTRKSIEADAVRTRLKDVVDAAVLAALKDGEAVIKIRVWRAKP